MSKLPERMMARSGTFYCRIWVPTDIAPIYGRQLVVRSLRTKDLKTAKTRLARKSVELENRFDEIRAKGVSASDVAIATPPDPRGIRARFSEIARDHAIAASDGEFARRAELFSQVTAAPEKFWRGEFGDLPTAADFGHAEQDAYTYFDHLVAEGDLETVISFVNRFRLGIDRVPRRGVAGRIAFKAQRWRRLHLVIPPAIKLSPASSEHWSD